MIPAPANSTPLPICRRAPDEQEADGTGATSTECFTLAQRQAIKEIYDGPHDSDGNPWYVGTPVGGEFIGGRGPNFPIEDGRAPQMFAYIALDPPDGPAFDMMSFDWDIDPLRAQETTCEQRYDDGTSEIFNVHDVLDAITMSDKPVPNMGGFGPVYAKGAKIIQQHGWSDPLSSPLGGAVNFYEQVMNIMGVEKTKSFYKLYMVPGGAHSSGGLGYWPSTEETFQQLVDWVENGEEPAEIEGSQDPKDFADPVTRPVCPYPEVARWDGVGSIKDPGSFSCVPPVEVNIKPETINLKSRGVFTAMITLPEGYDLRDWNLDDLSCEGAPAIKGKLVRKQVHCPIQDPGSR